ncbi:MAG: KEOPS complex subunit Pcc1 [Candidatus Heimdallarchaeota archaeon]
MKDKFSFVLSIQFDTAEETRVVHQALLPEFKAVRFERSHTDISLVEKGKAIKIKIAAQDGNASRAAINTVLRWIKISSEVIHILNTSQQ